MAYRAEALRLLAAILIGKTSADHEEDFALSPCLTFRAALGSLLAMLRTSGWHFARLWSLALRRLIAACVVLSMVAAPVAAGLVTHHSDDLDSPAFAAAVSGAEVALPLAAAKDVAVDSAKSGAAAQTKHVVPSADHDCHGCAAVLLPAADATRLAEVVAVTGTTIPALGSGRAVPADPRPPRA